MKTMTLAVATIAISTAFLPLGDRAFAKGPFDLQGSPAVILVKESPTELDMKDFPFGLKEGTSKNVRISFDQEVPVPEEEDATVGIRYVVDLPTLEVEKDGDDKVTVSFPETYKGSVTLDSEGENIELNFDGEAESQTMTFERDGDRMTYTGSADSFSIAVTSPQAVEEGINFVFKMGGDGFSMAGEGAAEQDWTDMQNLDVSYDYTMDDFTFGVVATGEGDDADQRFEMSGKGREIAASGQIGKGRIEAKSDVSGFEVAIARPLAIDASIGKLSTEIGMPTDPSPEPQDIKYLIDAEDIILDDFLWSIMDPQEAFPRDLKKVVIDFEMQATLIVSLLDPAAMAELESGGLPPVIPIKAKINSIAFDGLGLKFDATGEGSLEGAQPEGEAYVSVKGLSDFVVSAVKAGMFGQQESIMIEGMAGQLGKEGDDGELIFDITTDGAMLNINGAPIMPIPGAQ